MIPLEFHDFYSLSNDMVRKCSGKESRVSSYEELKERLRKRMEMLRAKRNADAALKTAKNAQKWRNETKKSSQNQSRKRKATFSGSDLEENGGAKHIKKATQSLENGQINKVRVLRHFFLRLAIVTVIITTIPICDLKRVENSFTG